MARWVGPRGRPGAAVGTATGWAGGSAREKDSQLLFEKSTVAFQELRGSTLTQKTYSFERGLKTTFGR